MDQFTVTTPFGDTDLWRVGQGSPMLVLHGGPGMDHSYLISALCGLRDLRTLIFFDQLGCGRTGRETSKVTAESTLRHIESIVSVIAPPASALRLLAHSWGTHLASQLLLEDKFKIAELVLISPFPDTTEGLEASFQTLLSRIPKGTSEKISKIGQDATRGSELMDLLLPFYVHKSDVWFPPEIRTYNPVLNDLVLSSLGSFDMRAVASLLPPRSLVIRGDADFVPFETVRSVFEAAGKAVTLTDVGHFPFFERISEFNQVVTSFLNANG